MFNDVTSSYDMSDATWEILIMLLGAFILGFILRHLLGCKSESEDIEPLAEAEPLAEPELKSEVTESDIGLELGFGLIPEPEPEVEKPIVTKTPESLQQVEGVGPKIEELLHNGKVLTMSDLASTNVERLQEILDAAGSRFRMHNPASWAPQAELIVDENWDELKKYQDFLVAGREK